jgi:hypothetical protein
MEKNIQNFIFKKYETLWMTDISFGEFNSTFEIYKESIDENLVNTILSSLTTRVISLVKEAPRLLKYLADNFFGQQTQFTFKFSGIVIGLNHNEVVTDFRICFRAFDKENFSGMENWFVDVKNFRIIGCRLEM